MLRPLVYGAVAAGFIVFAVFAVRGIGGWLEARAPEVIEKASGDEIPLKTGFVSKADAVKEAFTGYPWEKFRAEIIAARRELPDDPAPMSREDQLKHNERVASAMTHEFPARDYTYAEIRDLLPKQIEYLNVYFPKPQPADTLMIPVPKVTKPDGKWEGFTFFSFLRAITQNQVDCLVTSEGIAVGTPAACDRAKYDSELIGFRRRVAKENADSRLDVMVRPDVVDASILAFLRTIEGQSGIPIVMDARIWDRMFGLAWRGEPRKLRDLLDELCQAFRIFWRFKDGRIYLLTPEA